MPRFSIIDEHGWAIASAIAETAQIASDCFKGLTAIDTTNETRNPFHGAQYVNNEWILPPLPGEEN